MIKSINTIILTITAMAFCNIAVSAQQTFAIKGIVVESETNEPLIGASVRCGSVGAATDNDGKYELSVKEGSYDMECS